MQRNEHYGEGYRHFDQLIWAVPAVVALIISGFSPVLSSLGDITASSSILDKNNVTYVLSNAAALYAMAAVSLTVFRFRYHQNKLKWYARTSAFSPQTLLQLSLNEGVAFFIGAILVFAQRKLNVVLPSTQLILIGGALVAVAAMVTYRQEIVLRAVHDETWKEQEGLTDESETIGLGGS